mgnify:CR=1 FL=1
MNQASACRQAFQACTSWEQRARLLLRYGQQLPRLTGQQRQQASLLRGCESPVWWLVELHQGCLQIQLDTDARLLRGLLAVLLLRLQGLTPQQLTQLDIADWFTRLGLSRQLSASRANGLNAVLTHIAARACELA